MERETKSNYSSILRNGYIQAFAWTLEFMALTLAILAPMRSYGNITVPTLVMVLIWALGLLNIELLHFWLRREARTLDKTIDLMQFNEQKYRSIIEQSYDGIVITDSTGSIIEWNRGQRNLCGLDRDEVLGKPIWQIYHNLLPEEMRTKEQLERLRVEFQMIRKSDWQELQGKQLQNIIAHQTDKTIRILQHVFFIINSNNDPLLGFISRDITEQSNNQKMLRENEERFRSLFQSAPICYQSMDSTGNILEVNQAWIDEMGYSREEVIGHKFMEFLTPDSRLDFPSILWRYLMAGELENIEFETIRKDGTVILIDYHGKVGYDEKRHFKQTHCVFFNITDRKKMEQEMQRLVVTDVLTGLFNRRHYFAQAENEFKRARRHELPLSAIMMDVDNFKRINDTNGHIAGDQVLQTIAQTCQHVMRDIDIIGRYGGDEIAILLPNTDEKHAFQAAERLRLEIQNLDEEKSHLSQPFTISLGIAQLNEDDFNIESLQDRADQALFAAKNAGRNQTKLWEIDSDELS